MVNASPASANAAAPDLRRLIVPKALHVSALVAEHGVPTQPLVVHHAGEGYEVIITVRRCRSRGDFDEERMTQCMRDAEVVLLDADRVLSTRQVADEMAGRGMIWAYITISNSLTKLVKIGRARSSRKAPRGYVHSANAGPEPETILPARRA